MEVNKEAAIRIESQTLHHDEMESVIVCLDVMSEIIDEVESRYEENNNKVLLQVVKGRKEFPWSTKSVIIYFYLHEHLGNRDHQFTGNVFSVNTIFHRYWQSG